MANYRFVGATAQLHRNGKTVDLNYFGQPIDLSPEEAKQHVASRIALLAQADFNACGFTSDELNRWATAAEIRSAPADFLVKVEEARKKFSTQLAALLSPVAAAPVAAPVAEASTPAAKPEVVVVPSTPEVKPTNASS